MTVKARLTKPFDVVYILDEAIAELGTEAIARYINNGRNIEDLDIATCKEQPSIFTCEPLKPEYQYLLNNLNSNGQLTIDEAWSIFRRHVKAAKNYTQENGDPILVWEDGPKGLIDSDCQKYVDIDMVRDIAATIVKKAGHITVNFTAPVGLWAQIAKIQEHHASGADTETVSKTISQ